ncbi:MAG: D-alanyl-D-alanine carboxypeptidase [Coriobacteriales bacterium]|nr:D-alanyl-D-alanine carboxypeptidase [Coriobacteriales bacterium]
MSASPKKRTQQATGARRGQAPVDFSPKEDRGHKPSAGGLKSILTKVIIIVVCLSFVLSMAFGVVMGGSWSNVLKQANASQKATDMISGVPLDQYQPSQVADSPNVNASADLVATANGTVLFARDPDKQRSIASITKIMTAMISLESTPLDTEMKVTAGAAAQTDNYILKAGMTMTFGQLIQCMLIPSNNAAAVAIAENVSGSEQKFVDLMNAKARSLGMDSTYYADASGLSPQDVSTCHDLYILERYAFKNSTFTSIVKPHTVKLKVGSTTITLNSTDHLQQWLPQDTVLGMKTGTTLKAGCCFAGSAVRGGIQLFSVVLGGTYNDMRFSDTAAMMKWAWAHYRPIQLLNPTQQVANISCSAWIDQTVPAYSSGNVDVTLFDMAGDLTQQLQVKNNGGSVESGEVVGTMTWLQGGQVVATCNLVAAKDVPGPNFIQGIGQFFIKTVNIMFGGRGAAQTTCLLQHQVPVPS